MSANLASVSVNGAIAGHRPARALLIGTMLALALAGCYKRSVLTQSEGHVSTPAATPALPDVPAPARNSTFVQPPKPAVNTDLHGGRQ